MEQRTFLVYFLGRECLALFQMSPNGYGPKCESHTTGHPSRTRLFAQRAILLESLPPPHLDAADWDHGFPRQEVQQGFCGRGYQSSSIRFGDKMRCDEQLHWDIYEALKGEIVDDVSIYIYIHIFIDIIILGAWSIHGGFYF